MVWEYTQSYLRMVHSDGLCLGTRYLYTRFFTKGNHISNLIWMAMLPAMMQAVDVYNSINFFFQAQLVLTFAQVDRRTNSF